MTALARLFHPASIAVVGASDDPVKIGGRPLAFLLRHGYRGRVFPVNPGRPTVQGLPAFPSLGAIPEPVDLAIVVVPAERVLATLEEAAARGVRGAIVFSSGFAEAGAGGEALQEQMRALARRTGLRVMGPNCQGFAHLPGRLLATFASPFLEEPLEAGPLSVVSQSGAMASMIYEMARAAGLGLTYWVSTGNEADVEAAEALGAVVEEPGTRVALCYLEDVKNAAAFREALARAHRRGVPVFVLKAGRSAAGRRAAASHTGALAGEDQVYEAVFRDWGAIRCADPRDLVERPRAFVHYQATGPRVAVLTNSGGLGVLSVDQCLDLGLVPAEFTAETTAGLRQALPEFAAPRNPVDLTAQLLNDPMILTRVLPLLEADPGVDVVAVQIAVLGRAADLGRIVGDIAGLARRGAKVVAVSCPQGWVVERFRAAGVLTFDDPGALLRSLACLVHAARERPRWLARTSAPVPPPPPAPAGDPPRASAEGFLSEWDSRRLLEPFGLPLVPAVLARDPSEAARAAGALGYPVVVKGSGATLPHKSDVGAVVLGLGSPAAVTAACEEILAAVARRAPAARLEGFLLQPEVRGALELALGVKTDPTFGPVVLVGAGGLLVEALRDVRLLLPPVDAQAAEEALRGLRIGALWDGARGRPALDLAAAVDLVVRLGEAARALAGHVAELDLNPVLVGRRGEGVCVVDALARLGPPAAAP